MTQRNPSADCVQRSRCARGLFSSFLSLAGALLTLRQAGCARLALLLQQKVRLEAAKPLSREALAKARQLLGAEHPHVVAYWLATAHINQGEFAEAAEALRENVRLMESAYPTHLYLHANRSLLGGCLTKLGQYAEAEPPVVQSYEQVAKLLGEKHVQTQTARKRVIALYGAMGDTGKGDEYSARIPDEAAAGSGSP